MSDKNGVTNISITMHDKKMEFAFSETNQKWELCKWLDDDSHKIVIAFFDRDSEGYDMRTVGARFFEHDGAYVAANRAMKLLKVIHEIEEDDK